MRAFALPDSVDAAAIRAESKDGVLRIRIPKTTTEQPKKLSVEVQ
jgi:HSP20 family protein